MIDVQSAGSATGPKYLNKSQVWSAVGMWAWLIHRITGVGLALYLFIHIVLMSISIIEGPKIFNYTLKLLMGNPFFLAIDLLLTMAVLYHALNGIRLILFDVGIGYGRQKEIFWVAMGIGMLVFIGILVKVLPAFGR